MPSKSPAQHRLMEAVAHNPKFASKVGIPVSVGQDFAAADKKVKKFAGGGSVPDPTSTHTTTQGYDASNQPLQGSGLLAALRGWGAGTAGIPGDIEGMLRALANKSFSYPGHMNPVDPNPILPTSEFYKKSDFLPGKQPGDEAISDLTSMLGGVGVTRPVSGALSLGKRVGQLSLEQVARGMQGEGALAKALAPIQPAYVIKNTGGQWLTGSVEDALKGLKKTSAYVGMPADLMEASVPQDTALNNFIDKQLTRYVQKDMATPNDPIRALAERGTLHIDGQPWGPTPGITVERLRSDAGFSPDGAGQSELARTWENMSDAMLRQKSAGVYTAPVKGPRTGLTAPSAEVLANPWLAKVDPTAPVFTTKDNGLSVNLGFDHLIDELRNATTVNSGLPAPLQLRPESLARLSVPQAVQRVADINDWRSAQMAEANAAKANNAATVPVKTYDTVPGTDQLNEKGLKWVQLKAQDTLPEGYSIKEFPPETLPNGQTAKNSSFGLYGPKGEFIANASSPDTLIKQAVSPDLVAAHQYEGDTMGHCIAGQDYVDKNLAGTHRYFSLRDAKGQPHVTIETIPSGIGVHSPAQYKKAWEQAGLDPEEFQKWMTGNKPLPKKALALLEQDPPRIEQIKGKGNKKPNDEYLPFVQDFVKSGNWSDVGDLQNTGLKATRDPGGRLSYMTPDESAAQDTLDITGLPPPDNAPQGYAAGGSVALPGPSDLPDSDQNSTIGPDTFGMGGAGAPSDSNSAPRFYKGGSVSLPHLMRHHQLMQTDPMTMTPDDHSFMQSMSQAGAF